MVTILAGHITAVGLIVEVYEVDSMEAAKQLKADLTILGNGSKGLVFRNASASVADAYNQIRAEYSNINVAIRGC